MKSDIAVEWVGWNDRQTNPKGDWFAWLDRLGFHSVSCWLAINFGSHTLARRAEYLRLIREDVGDLGTMGWDLSDPSDEGIPPAIEWLDQQIALARAPYGNTALVLSIYPLTSDGQSIVPDERVYRLRPFRKKDWSAMKPLAVQWLKAAAERSPSRAAATNLFNLGEVMLAEMQRKR